MVSADQGCFYRAGLQLHVFPVRASQEELRRWLTSCRFARRRENSSSSSSFIMYYSTRIYDDKFGILKMRVRSINLGTKYFIVYDDLIWWSFEKNENFLRILFFPKNWFTNSPKFTNPLKRYFLPQRFSPKVVYVFVPLTHAHSWMRSANEPGGGLRGGSCPSSLGRRLFSAEAKIWA